MIKYAYDYYYVSETKCVPPQAQRLITLGLNNSLAKIIPCSHEIS
jgi:hypothetical protein